MSIRLERLSALEAEDLQRRAAGGLARAGLGPGQKLAFTLGSSKHLLCAVLAATRSAITPVMINAQLTPGEMAEQIADCDPQLVLDSEAQLAALFDAPSRELAPYPLTRPMHYSSGTTGKAKGIVTAIWDEATAKAVFEDEAELWSFSPDDLHLLCSPMYHTVSIRFSAGTLLSGGSLLLMSKFDASTALESLRRDRPNTSFLVPTHLQRILSLPQLGSDEIFDSLRFLAHAGSACPPVLKYAAMERVGADALIEFYGSTEGQFTICPQQLWLEHPGTVGKARPGRRLFIDPDSVDDHGIGQIWCEAPSFAKFAYHRDPLATQAAWRGDAFSVGDLGHLDDEGLLYLDGRRDDLVISGGINVYPAEVEASLLGLSGVEQICVFGLDDPEWGQRLCAAVVADGPQREAALRERAATRLAPFKRPKDYYFVDDLPMTSTGKVLRRSLPELLGQP